MIIKKKKAVISALISAVMAASAIVPTMTASAAGTRTKPEAFGDQTYAQRFLSLYDDVVTKGVDSGYLSKNNIASGGFGVPYHCVEELNIEAPDNGHETTSEAMSYIVWMAAMRDALTKKGVTDASGSQVAPSNDLEKAWKTMEVMIPTVQTGFMAKSELSAQYSAEHDTPEEYPTAQDPQNTGKNPLAGTFSSAYGGDNGLYLMHWLADVDDWYGYGQDSEYGNPGKFTFINTFQRGAQESCWETVPHACIENLQFGMKGSRGIKGVFSTDDQVAPQWSYTNAPDAEDRAIQGVYYAKRMGVASSDVLAKAGKMGDQLRNNMFDKYYKKIGTTSENTPQDTSNAYSGAHYLMSWYTSWGGALEGTWAWQIGASHCHEFYQNPLAAYALLADSDLKSGMKAQGAEDDYMISLQRQLEFYLWLQSEDGPIAGGATSSWHGRYLPFEYLKGVDDEYINKYGTSKPTMFYNMGYQEHPVYADPGSNHWIGNQVWAIQRLAELYYDIKTNPTSVSQKIKAGGLSMEEALAKILDRWVAWFIDNTELTADGDYTIPASLDWEGQPKDWQGLYSEKTGVTCKVVARGNSDVGCVSSFCNTLIWYAKANGVKPSDAAEQSSNLGAKALYYADQLLSRQWEIARDDIGLSRTEHNGSMWRLFEQEVWVPTNYDGTMPNGDPLKNGATFLSIRSMYNTNAKVQEFKTHYEAAKAAGYKGGSEGMTEELEKVDLTYHRFWHAGDAMVAMGTMADLYPDLKPGETSGNTPTPGPGNEETLQILNPSITVEVGGSDTIKTNVPGSTFTPSGSGVTVDSTGKVTGVTPGTTTVTVTTPGGQTGSVTVTVTPPGGTLPGTTGDYLYGDVDLNGEVALADVITLGKYVVSPSLFPLGFGDADSRNKAMEQANVQYDNAIDTMDLNRLVEYNLGKLQMKDLGPGQ